MVNVNVIVGLDVGDFYYVICLLVLVVEYMNGKLRKFDMMINMISVMLSVKKCLFVF